MKAPNVKFNAKDQPAFFNELRSRVNTYFKDNNLSKYGNWNMKLKTAFMLSLLFIPFILILTDVVTSSWTVLFMWVLMGFGTSGIGLSIMHDANHGAYSKNDRVNKILGYLFNLIGSYHVNWKIQHNVLHHSFTNVEGYDEDIDTPVLRFTPNQERKKLHKFQAFYASFFYGIMTLNWIINKDFKQLKKYADDDLLSDQGLTFKSALTSTILIKLGYFSLMVGLPMLLSSLPWWHTLLGFFIMHFVCGLTLAFIFQTAHVIEDTAFPKLDENNNLENNWAIHQMRTTANFANKSRVFSWFIGGLNYQIEHHLFPNICHVHYRKISKIVKETASEFNVPYNHHTTFFSALKSHFSLLNQLGTGSYDRNLKTENA